MHFWPKFGNTDFNLWWLIAWTSSKCGKFWLLSSIWPWSSRSIIPKNNRDLNQGLLHLWSKFGDSSLNGWWVTARTSWWLTDRHTHTHTQATTIPEGQNWPRVIKSRLIWHHLQKTPVIIYQIFIKMYPNLHIPLFRKELVEYAYHVLLSNRAMSHNPDLM